MMCQFASKAEDRKDGEARARGSYTVTFTHGKWSHCGGNRDTHATPKQTHTYIHTILLTKQDPSCMHRLAISLRTYACR